MEIINPYFIRYTELPEYEEFYENVMSKNIVCSFPSELTQKWSCRKDWVTDSGSINFEYLDKNYGNMTCPVYKCNESYYNSNPVSDMTLSEYMKYWREVIKVEHRYIEKDLEILYLKDWHLFYDSCSKKEDIVKKQQEVFVLPKYFASDYLNDFCVEKKIMDYKFVYLGPKGSR